MKIAILGFGREGQSILKFLKKNRQYKNAGIWIVDKKATIKLPHGIHAQIGKNYLRNLKKFDIIFRSPGIPYNLPELKKARQKGVKFSSATKIFFDECPAKIIGITGTKGKGTTSTLLYQMLKAAGKQVFLAGNIGRPMLDILPNLISINQRKNQHKSAYAILELSSFQLQDLRESPEIAVVLDIFPDHQDAHRSLKEYYEAKANIARFQKPSNKILFFSARGGSAYGGKNNRLSSWVAQKSRGRKITVDESKFKLFKPSDLKINGQHNFKNAVMAATIARNLGVSEKTILRVAKNFRGLEHRLELVREIRIYSRKYSRPFASIKFYNDSASTNPQTTAAALESFPNEEKILIAGGQDKNLDYKPLAKALKNSGTKLVVLLGENKKKISKAIKNSGVPIKLVKNLREAVKIAYNYSKFYILNSTFSSVIFSPGAASFDMFENYADRGEQFKKIVKTL